MELLMAFLNNQHAGDIPSKCETGTRVLIRSSSCCVQTLLRVSIVPSRPVVHLPRSRDIVLAIDFIVPIACPFMGGTLWRCSAVCPATYRVLA
jgi:hypothetical protein